MRKTNFDLFFAAYYVSFFLVSFYSSFTDAPTRAKFLFQVLLGIGVLFRVGTPHSR